MNLILWLLLAAVALATAALHLIVREIHIHALNTRVAHVITGAAGRPSPGPRISDWLSRLGTRYRRFYRAEGLEQFRMTVQTSGFNPHRAMPVLLGGKMVSMIFFPAAAALAAAFAGSPAREVLLFALIGAIIGIMGPQGLLWAMRRGFNAAVQRGTPDAIDLLVICSEAGMGLESGLERVAQEMSRSNPAMARVLSGLLDDLRVLPDRRDALENLANRSTTDGLRRFGTMINQSLQYGTPLSAALRAIAEELRRDRMIRLEERAHKLGPKLILPMVLFLLPAMFITMGASSFLHLMRAFKAL